MVAELHHGEVTRSWIWHPQHQTSYVAELGAGAYRTTAGGTPERLTRSAAPPVPIEWRAVTSRRSWVGRELTGLRPLELTWVCCGVDYPRLVEGRADAVLYGHANAWDHAPGALLLSESGGHHGTIDGAAYDPRSPERPGLIAAADRATYDAMVALATELPGRRWPISRRTRGRRPGWRRTPRRASRPNLRSRCSGSPCCPCRGCRPCPRPGRSPRRPSSGSGRCRDRRC